jgi:protein-disulfide isomerase
MTERRAGARAGAIARWQVIRPWLGTLARLGLAASGCPLAPPRVTDQRYAGWTEQVTEDATRAGVSGTPTVRVDGQDVLPSVEAMVAAVQAAGPA